MSSTFFVSDTHFGHANIIKHSHRPFTDVEQMNEMMIKSWNETVQLNDEVWHLGDFTFLQYTPFRLLLARLNGRINVVLGNHDKVIASNIAGLTSAHGSGRSRPLLTSVQHYKELKVEGRFIVLFHYGQRVWNKSHHGSIMLYGHSHGTLPPHGLSVDVGVDCKEITLEYRPIGLDEVLKYMDARSKAIVDHHGADQKLELSGEDY